MGRSQLEFLPILWIYWSCRRDGSSDYPGGRRIGGAKYVSASDTEIDVGHGDGPVVCQVVYTRTTVYTGRSSSMRDVENQKVREKVTIG